MSSPDTPQTPGGNGKRKTALLTLAALFAAAGLAYGGWWATYGRYHEGTDDAYVAGNLVTLSSQVAGTVLAVQADDTDYVQAGEPLVALDPIDAQVALAKAEAELAQTAREVRTLFVATGALKANIAERRVALARAEKDLARREALLPQQAVSLEETQHAREAVAAARAALSAAEEQLATQESQIEGTGVADHPRVLAAAARFREAWITAKRASVPAPVSGFIAKRSVQVGSRIAAGAPLLSIVPLDALWVDANFKEVQLRRLHIGQAVKLTADLYGSQVEYDGKVVGMSAGTGAAFALLPAQNATGNWIKVVQRVPVRIALDPAQLKAHPLRIGLSMQVEVDTRDQSGPLLASARQNPAGHRTTVFDALGKEADERIRAIVAAHGVRARSR